MVERLATEPWQEILEAQVESVIVDPMLSVIIDQGTHARKTLFTFQEEECFLISIFWGTEDSVVLNSPTCPTKIIQNIMFIKAIMNEILLQFEITFVYLFLWFGHLFLWRTKGFSEILLICCLIVVSVESLIIIMAVNHI